MTMITRVETASLSDQDLLSRLVRLAGEVRTTTVELIIHLGEMDDRRLHRGLGFRSLFEYCVTVLRLSEHAAFNRIEAARVSRLFPVVLDRLADGSINLTTLRLLAPHLREENHVEVLAAAAGLKKKEVEVLIARLAPRPDVAESIRRVGGEVGPPPSPCLSGEVPADLGGTASQEHSPGCDQETAALPLFGSTPAPARAVPPSPGSVSPLSPQRYRVQFTIDQATFEKLRQLQDLVGGPDRELAALFDRGLTLQLAERANKKWAATSRPQTVTGGATRSAPVMIKRSRHVPAAVRRTVWARDEGRCAFRAHDGRRCSATARLEFHHIEPYAIGGEMTDRNISLRCRSHNAYEGARVFGKDTMTARAKLVPERVSTGPG